MKDHSKWHIMINKAILKELIDKVKPVSLHTRNLQIPVTEMFQVKIGEFLFITHEIF